MASLILDRVLDPVIPTALRHRLDGWSQRAVNAGLPTSWVGLRRVPRSELAAQANRRVALSTSASAFATNRLETLHEPAFASNPLPRNIERRDALPRDRGWWGYSFHDVPERLGGATRLATLHDCTLLFATRAPQDDFLVALLDDRGHGVDLREIRYRPEHAAQARNVAAAARMERATWVIERVYHNYSHWLGAHLPKFVLLADGSIGDARLRERIVLPSAAHRPSFVDASLAALDPSFRRLPTFDPARALRVEELTLLSTDRFRPELLRPVRDALASVPADRPHRRVFVSRAAASRRRLLNEEAIWPLLRAAGFERVRLETMDFDAQRRLMGETAVLFAPHGAGLTNMMFCHPGTQVIEIADLGFPNPNFYALACAMQHDYWLVPGRGVGDVHPLQKDLVVDEHDVAELLSRLPG